MPIHRLISAHLFAPLAALVAVQLGACATSSSGDGGLDASSDAGSDAHADAGGDASADGGGDAGVDASTDGGVVPLCPAAMPADGASCAREGLVCEYGSDPRISCRTTATCTGGTFHVGVAGCPPPPTDTCPPTRAAAAGATCAVADAYCTYGDLFCHCTDCPRGAPLCGPTTMLRWDCDAPNPDPACPQAMPARGSACTMESQRCVYWCGGGGARTCTDGVWVETDGDTCPISTRRAKRDIAYLAPAEVDALADEVRGVRLATYEYTDPALAGRRHLGLIIEDQPDGSFAVESSRAQVDLYGYTSLVLATVQAQQRQIEALRAEVDALRAERGAPLCSGP